MFTMYNAERLIQILTRFAVGDEWKEEKCFLNMTKTVGSQ